jgi:hypothetical protein
VNTLRLRQIVALDDGLGDEGELLPGLQSGGPVLEGVADAFPPGVSFGTAEAERADRRGGIRHPEKDGRAFLARAADAAGGGRGDDFHREDTIARRR